MSRRSVQNVRLFSVLVLCTGLVGCPLEDKNTVPDCGGMTQAAAETAILGAGLVVGDVAQAYSSTVAAGLVASQDPAAGQRVDPGSSVDLVVSKGPEPQSVDIPDVVGMTQTNAENAITWVGLTVGSVTQAYSDTVSAGMVISQDPAAGTEVDPASAVGIEVSMGPEPVSVPNLVGMTQSAAEEALTNLGLEAGDIAQENDNTAAAGTVIAQDPAAGSSVSPGTEVDMTVSLGAEMVTVPDVVTLLQSDAEDEITDEGLVVGTITPGLSDIIASGYVISQSLEPDSEAPSGSAVNLVVASGLATEIQVPMAMVDIAGATFQMGDGSAARPIHTVTISSYEMGVYEVTTAEYCAVLNWAVSAGYLTGTTGNISYDGRLLVDIKTTPSDGTGARLEYVDGVFVPSVTYGFSRDLHPMASVTWYGAVAFCNWLSEWEGLTPAYDFETWALVGVTPEVTGVQFTNGYRLPTEAEWEYAAAWDGDTRYVYGFSSDTLSLSRANYDGANPLGIKGYPYSTIVGYYDGVNPDTVYSVSPSGCFDMTGNVREWCYDWLKSYPDEALVNPIGPTTSETYKVMRGGWYSMSELATELTTTERGANYAGVEGTDLGFRICRSIESR